jgi:hypothetical protein
MIVETIPIDKIELDERNPRIAHTLEAIEAGARQDFIGLSLGQASPEDEDRHGGTTYTALKASIRQNHGVITPIIVSPKNDGTYLVIEGNTRVAIYRELTEQGPPEEWLTIPAIVQQLTEQGEHAIRLQAHLVGPRPWRPYAKAKYLHDLYVNQKLSISEIVDFCGGTARKREIEQYIDAYRDMHTHYMPLVANGTPDYTRFSSFVELQKKPGLKQAIARAGFTLDDFAKWVDDGKIAMQENVRNLDRILGNADAKREFLAHDTREAIKVLEQPSSNAIISGASLEQLARGLAAKVRSLNWPDVQSMTASPDGPVSQALIDCLDEVRNLVKQILPDNDV